MSLDFCRRGDTSLIMLVVEKSVEKEKSVEISMQGCIISSAEYFATIDFLRIFGIFDKQGSYSVFK